MKKIVSVLLCTSVLWINGCAKKETSVISEKNIHAWHVLPEVEASSLKNLVPFSFKIIRNGEREARMLENQTGLLNQFENTGYTDNAILIQKDDAQVIYDYHGNVLYTPEEKVSETYLTEGVTTCYAHEKSDENYFSVAYGTRVADEKGVILDPTFTSQSEIGINDLILHPYDGNQVFDEIAIKDGKIGISYHLKNKAGEDAAGYGFEETDVHLNNMCLAERLNTNNEPIEQVIIDKSGTILSKVPGEVYLQTYGAFVNGYYSCYQKEDKSKTLALVEAKSGKEITPYQYKNVGYFEDGYCPVQNTDGKWAYINEKGEEVTDFLFDAASSIFEGKAWIIKDGKAGVLNIEASQNGKFTNAIYTDTVSDEKVLSEKRDVEETKPVIGTVKVNISSLNIRKTPSMDGEKVGVASSKTYDVFDTSDSDGYTWYKIGDDQWIAGNQEWVTYTKK